MHVHDVAIVGGGPAGSACAWKLRRAGLDVVVCDRAAFPRDKLCAGWITPQTATALELDLAEYAARGNTLQPISGFRLSQLGDPDVRVVYGEPVSYSIRRCEFDHFLLQRAAVTLRLSRAVRRLTRVNGEWLVDDDVRARVLIGAGGHFCPVAQHLGARLGEGEPVVAAQECEFPLTAEDAAACQVELDVPELFFTRDLKGYGWVLRKGRFLNVGLGRQDTARLSAHVAEFVEYLSARRKVPPRLSAKLRGHPYLLYDEAPRPLGGDGALLIGDAAGLAYPRSGEGIRPAIESGLLAAEVIAAARGCVGAEEIAAYTRRLGERFGPRQRRWGVTDLLPAWATNAIAGRLLHTAWFARHVVLDRWFFHREQAALSPTVATPTRDFGIRADVVAAGETPL